MMKVFGTLVYHRGSQWRAVVAAKNQKQAAESLGVTLHHLKQFGSVTGNPVEVELANGEPGAVFWTDARLSGPRQYQRRS